MNQYGEYSEFTAEQIGIKFSGDEAYATAGAVGSVEEIMNTKTVTKKYKGIESKTRTKGDGTGELKLSIHMDYTVYKEIYGMNLDSLKDGIAAYGRNSTHPTFGITLLVLDEDDVKKLKAYPNCTVKTGRTGKIENGSEEVAEIEMTISVMPDEYGNGMYESLVEELPEDVTQDSWLNNFEPAMVQVAEV